MADTSPILMWFRRDLRLSDHPALSAACDSGRPVIPVFVRDSLVDGLMSAPKWRLGLGLEALEQNLKDKQSRLILRSGDALEVLQALIKETGATAVHWTRAYDPDSTSRDTKIKSALKDDGIEARSFGGHLMFEPWTAETKTGGFYKVYTPFWKALKDREVDAPLPTPGKIPAPASWPASDSLADWQMGAAMGRGRDVVAPFLQVGERAAQSRLGHFCAHLIAGYDAGRDIPGEDGTSRLSQNLTTGEISPHQCWHAGQRALAEGKAGAETFLKELVWREFAYHLMHHTPHILSRSWREEWAQFPWAEDERAREIWAWKQGRTGITFVDASMRELYISGTMHNRARMIVASYLTKHLMTHWRVGQKWFEDCLIDWDPASNAMGWQWSAGSGPDATPYFRVFNPDTQLEKFDKKGVYVRRWLAEGQRSPSETALSFYDAIPRSWTLSPDDRAPAPIVTLQEGRDRALDAYKNRAF